MELKEEEKVAWSWEQSGVKESGDNAFQEQ